MPHWTRHHINAGEIVVMRLERGDLIATHIGEHLDLMRPPIRRDGLQPSDERLAFSLRELHQRAEQINVLGPDELRRDVDFVARSVRGNHPSPRVAENAARRRECHRLRNVRTRHARPMLPLDELELDEHQKKYAKTSDRKKRHPFVALLELAELATMRKEVHASAPPSSRRA